MRWYERPVFWNAAAVLLLAGYLQSHFHMPGMPSSPRHGTIIAQPVPVPAASSNGYWAGYVISGRPPYTGVRASWTVPRTACDPRRRGTSTAYTWIGEGGYLRGLASSLIQAGVAGDCVNGVSRYHAFYEWYPGIFAADFPIAVRPGDRVDVQIALSGTNYWTLSIHNLATGARSTTATYDFVDTDSVDFIVERPTLCSASCGQVPLARFGNVTFENVRIATRGSPAAGETQAVPIALVSDDLSHPLAVPGHASRGTYSVLWRSER